MIQRNGAVFALICIFFALSAGVTAASVPGGPEVSVQANGSMLIRSTSDNPVFYTDFSGETAMSPVFELGRADRHWRVVDVWGRGNVHRLQMKPHTSYELWDTGQFPSYVLKALCGLDAGKLSRREQESHLAAALTNLRACKLTDESAYKVRLASEAYQELLGTRFRCEMHYYADDPAADYRIFAGRAFDVECTTTNGSREIGPCSVRIIAPDEWMVNGVAKPFTLSPFRTRRCRFTVTAPATSMLRPKQYPVIAELTFRHQGRKIVVHYPITVEVSAPFTASLNIISADKDYISADVTTKSLFPGIAMKDVSVYPFIPENIKVEPARQSFSFKDTGRFRVTYAKTGDPSPVLRAVTLRTKADEHTVDLRTVMEAYLPLGRRTYGEALRMNDADDGKTVSATVGDRRCRQTVASRPDGSRHMYFALSPNFPTSGNTYIAVTYFDGPQGSFRIQYDSQTGAYKDSPETVRLGGTNTWKEAVFALPDGRFANRQKAESDFRLTATGGDPPIADVLVSKFPLGDTRKP